MPGQTGTIEIDGIEIEVEHQKPLPAGGARFDLSTANKRWRIDLARNGDVEIVTTWRDGQLADLDEPDWLDAVVSRLGGR